MENLRTYEEFEFSKLNPFKRKNRKSLEDSMTDWIMKANGYKEDGIIRHDPRNKAWDEFGNETDEIPEADETDEIPEADEILEADEIPEADE